MTKSSKELKSDSDIAHIKIKLIEVEQTYPLRHQVLRPHQAIEECHYPGDHEPTTSHLAALQETNDGSDKNHSIETVLGVCSLYRQTHPQLSLSDSCQLRAMATLPVARGLGVGLALLTAAEQMAQSQGHQGLWANARDTALGFYQRAGYQIVGEQFTIAGIGEHWLVRKSLPPPSEL